MLGYVSSYITAAVAALQAAGSMSGVSVSDGPDVGYDVDEFGDRVVVGWEDGDSEALTASWSGGWHDMGPSAVHSGEAEIPITIYPSVMPDATTAERRAAAMALYAAVRAVLLPSPSGSGLSVAGVEWAQETAGRIHQGQTTAGPEVRIVMTIQIRVIG